jgi:hypothetical protein
LSYRKLRRKPCSTSSDAITSANFAEKSQRKNDERNKHMKIITNIIYPTFALFAFACSALLPAPKAFGVVPAPDGGYPGGNTAEGQAALLSLTSGGYNTAAGFLSLRSDTTGSFNTGVGAGTLVLNSGDQNTAIGAAALLLNTTGVNNTANGALALLNNSEGSFNTASGANALNSNTTGVRNTANGYGALFGNTTGSRNTANGVDVLFHNTEGDDNTGNGFQALVSNTTGNNNTAMGAQALVANTTGIYNTAIGLNALQNNTEGDYNTALGYYAGNDVTTAHDVIAIGIAGANVSNSCFIGQIRGVTPQIADAIPVLIDSAGQLGTMSSSARFKKEIEPMEQASEAILSLKPVTFHYKSDSKGTPQFGLIAEEVAQVNPNLVVRDADGEIYTVRYEAVNAMLLNEFLKAHRRIEEQDKRIDQLTAQLKEQALLIQKVNDKVELNRSAPQTVANGRK